MLAKKILVHFVLIALLLPLISCSSQNTGKEKIEPLSIYIMDYNMFVGDAVKSFNNTQKYNAIEVKTFYNDQQEAFTKELQAGLSSGKGPDIIVMPAYALPNLSKLIRNGSFCDLNTLIGNDSRFNLADYNEEVLNVGLINGARYFLPLSYTLEALFTTKEALDAFGLDANQPLLSLDMLEKITDPYVSGTNGNYKFLMNEPDIMSYGYGGTIRAQYESIHLDIDRISGLIGKFKNFASAMATPSQQGSEIIDMSKHLGNGEIAFLNSTLLGFKFLVEPYSTFKTEVTPEICAVSLDQGQTGALARPFEIVAINANCKDKKKAFEFVQLLMSKEMQTSDFMNGFPVNLAAYKSVREAFLNNPAAVRLTQGQSLEKLVTETDDLMENMVGCGLMDLDALNILYGEYYSFLKGDISSDIAAKNMEQRLSAYREKPLEVVKSPETDAPAAENRQSLTIQYMDFDLAVKNAIRSFEEKQTNVKIESKVYPLDAYEEYVTKLTTGILAGDGPDILHYTPQIFNSLRKTMATGVFCDLNPLISNDETFKTLELNNTIMEAGMHDGKRYFIPLRYQLPALLTTQGILEQYGININDGWTLDDLRKIVLDYAQSSKPGYFFSPSMNFKLILQSCGKEFIDYDAKKTHFQSQDFISLMMLYRDIYPYIMPENDPAVNELPALSLQNNRYLMDISFVNSPERLYIENSIYNEILGENAIVLPFPTLAANARKPVRIMNAASINATCNNKQAALDFIEELLSIDIQSALDKHGNSNITMGLPVNQKAFSKDLEFFVKPNPEPGTIGTGTRTFTPIPLPESLATRMFDLNNSISGPVYPDQAITTIINEGVQSFIDGKRTAEQAAKDIDDKVTLFLNE